MLNSQLPLVSGHGSNGTREWRSGWIEFSLLNSQFSIAVTPLPPQCTSECANCAGHYSAWPFCLGGFEALPLPLQRRLQAASLITIPLGLLGLIVATLAT